MLLAKTPDIIKPLANDLIWSFDRTSRDVYLTFDDGPTSDITYSILEILEEYEAKATFFCIGGNVVKHPEAYEAIIQSGHSIGNHTWNHMSGWEYSDFAYMRNVLECTGVVESKLFRPPYGRITRSQVRALKNRFSLVMWDVLSVDWKEEVSPEKCLSNVMKHTEGGSIVVFHDSEKARRNMLFALPRALRSLKALGYSFKAIPQA